MNELVSLKERILAALPDLAEYEWEARLSFDDAIPDYVTIYLPQKRGAAV